MTTIKGTAVDASGAPLAGRTVTARLVAATTALDEPGGQIITGAETVTGSDGTWSLILTPLSALLEPEGAYYVVVVGTERYTIDVPDSGTHELGTVLVEPGPLPSTGATAAALAALQEDVDGHVAATTSVHGITDTSTIVTAASAIADDSYVRGAGGGRGVEGRTPEQVRGDLGAAGVYVWDAGAESYVLSGGSVYLGPTDPGDVGDGSLWIDTGEE